MRGAEWAAEDCPLRHPSLAGSVPGVAKEAGRRLDESVVNPVSRGRTTPRAVLALLAVVPRHSLADVLGDVVQEGMLSVPDAEMLHGSFWFIFGGQPLG